MAAPVFMPPPQAGAALARGIMHAGSVGAGLGTGLGFGLGSDFGPGPGPGPGLAPHAHAHAHPHPHPSGTLSTVPAELAERARALSAAYTAKLEEKRRLLGG